MIEVMQKKGQLYIKGIRPHRFAPFCQFSLYNRKKPSTENNGMFRKTIIAVVLFSFFKFKLKNESRLA